MPIPQPHTFESYKHFVSRFLRNKEMKKDYPDVKNRFAVMSSTWSDAKK